LSGQQHKIPKPGNLHPAGIVVNKYTAFAQQILSAVSAVQKSWKAREISKAECNLQKAKEAPISLEVK
jgi:hypothetical protein